MSLNRAKKRWISYCCFWSCVCNLRRRQRQKAKCTYGIIDAYIRRNKSSLPSVVLVKPGKKVNDEKRNTKTRERERKRKIDCSFSHQTHYLFTLKLAEVTHRYIFFFWPATWLTTNNWLPFYYLYRFVSKEESREQISPIRYYRCWPPVGHDIELNQIHGSFQAMMETKSSSSVIWITAWLVTMPSKKVISSTSIFQCYTKKKIFYVEILQMVIKIGGKNS